jgi:hypothetical protein
MSMDNPALLHIRWTELAKRTSEMHSLRRKIEEERKQINEQRDKINEQRGDDQWTDQRTEEQSSWRAKR